MKNTLAKVSPAQWAGVVIAVLAVIFVLMNRDSFEITLLWMHLSGPGWLILLIVFAVGWLVGVLTTRKRNKAKTAP